MFQMLGVFAEFEHPMIGEREPGSPCREPRAKRWADVEDSQPG
jgi:hypothetical protein